MKTVKLRLVMEVEYAPNGVPTTELREMMHDCVTRALNDGTLTGDTEATVEQHRAYTEVMT